MDRSHSTSFQQVEDWLRGLGLLQYAQSFYDNGYEDVETCKEITTEDLDVIGVKSDRDRHDIVSAVQRLKQNVYFELEVPVVEKSEPVKLEPIILKSKLKETLTQKNVQLTEPPYYYPDGTLGDLYPLAITLADELCTVFTDVLDGLEQLRKRQLPAQTYDQMTELPPNGDDKRRSSTLLDPAEYLNCEVNSKNRGHSFSKYDKRATKSTTDLTKDIHHERSASAPHTNKYKVSGKQSKFEEGKGKSRFGSMFRKDTVKSNKGKELHHEFKADELDMSRDEISDIITKIKNNEISQEEVLAVVKKRTSTSDGKHSPNTTLERNEGSETFSISSSNSLGKSSKKGKISKNMIKRTPSAHFYTTKDDSTPYMIPAGSNQNSLERKRSGSSLGGGEESQPGSTKSSPEMGKHGIMSKIRSSMRKKGKGNEHDESSSLNNQSGGSISSQENISINEDIPGSGSPEVKRHDDQPPPPPAKPCKPVATNVYQDPLPILPISKPNPPKPPPPTTKPKRIPTSSTTDDADNWEVFDDNNVTNTNSETDNRPVTTKHKRSPNAARHTPNSNKANHNNKNNNDNSGATKIPLMPGGGAGRGRGLKLDLNQSNLKPVPKAPPRIVKSSPNDDEKPKTPRAPPRVKRDSKGVQTPVTPISIDGIDDIGQNMDNIIAGLDDRLNDIQDNYVDESQLPSTTTTTTKNFVPDEKAEKPVPVKKPSITHNKRPILPPKPPSNDGPSPSEKNVHISSSAPSSRKNSSTPFVPLPLKKILWKKLRSEGVQIHETPYTTTDGLWEVPHSLVKRYAEELNKSTDDITSQLESLRKEACAKVKLPFTPYIEERKNSHQLAKNFSLNQWLIYHGLPMFVSDLQEVSVTTIEQINELNDSDFKSIGVYHDRHINQLKSVARQYSRKSSIVFF